MIVADGEDVVVNHVPMVVDQTTGAHGTLAGHVARVNPMWRTLHAHERSILVVFHGLESYVAPTWYPSTQDDPRVVPT